jgi:hypothetical protein
MWYFAAMSKPIAAIQAGDWVKTQTGRKGRVLSIGRLTATLETWTDGNYVRIGCLLTRLVRANRENSSSSH